MPYILDANDKKEIETEISEIKESITNIFDDTKIVDIENINVYSNTYLYVSGSNVAIGNTATDIDSVVVDIDKCGQQILIGFDSNISYQNQSIMGATSTNIPSACVMYYSINEFINGSSTFEQRGFDLSHLSEGYYTIDKEKLLKERPTLKALIVNCKKDKKILKTNVEKPLKKPKWLNVNGYIPSIIVATDGSGDYKTIQNAIENAKNGDTIYIKDGEYKETVIVNKYVHLVGQSKQGTILYQNIGDYDNCPLLMTQGSVCNMTIKSLSPTDTSKLTSYAYAIHLDKYFADESKYRKCEIFNCEIYSEVNDGIGAGTNYDSEYDIHDCFITVRKNPIKSGACGFKCHNGQNQTTGMVKLFYNVINTESADGGGTHDILFHNGGISNTQPIEVIMIGNITKYYTNTCPNIFVNSSLSFGNKAQTMNN